MKSVSSKWLLPGALAFSTFAADYFSKGWANSHLHFGDARIFLPGFLHFTLTRNPGAAFGIGRRQSSLMALIACTIVFGIMFWMFKREKSETPPNTLERCGVGIIIGGALGNLFDRLTRGEVTDFLDFSFMDFPVFNVADAMIDVGAGLVILGAFTYAKLKKADEQHAGSVIDDSGEESKK